MHEKERERKSVRKRINDVRDTCRSIEAYRKDEEKLEREREYGMKRREKRETGNPIQFRSLSKGLSKSRALIEKTSKERIRGHRIETSKREKEQRNDKIWRRVNNLISREGKRTEEED